MQLTPQGMGSSGKRKTKRIILLGSDFAMRSLFCFCCLGIGIFVAVQAKKFTTKYPEPGPVISSVEGVNLRARQLNFYIIANGKHAVVKNKTITIDGHALTYSVSLPPFSIKKRGAVCIVTADAEQYTADRPSIVQMLAATGHRVVLLDVRQIRDEPALAVSSTVPILAMLEDAPQFIILTDATAQDEIAGWLHDMPTSGFVEALVALDFDESSFDKLRAFAMPTVVIGDVSGELKLPNAQLVPLPNGEMQADFVMQILQNFLDFLHVR